MNRESLTVTCVLNLLNPEQIKELRSRIKPKYAIVRLNTDLYYTGYDKIQKVELIYDIISLKERIKEILKKRLFKYDSKTSKGYLYKYDEDSPHKLTEIKPIDTEEYYSACECARFYNRYVHIDDAIEHFIKYKHYKTMTRIFHLNVF